MAAADGSRALPVIANGLTPPDASSA